MLQCNFGVVFFVCLFALVFLTCKNSGLVPRGFSSDEVSFNRMISYVLKKKKGKKKKEEVLKTFLKQHHLKDSVQFSKVHKHMLLFSKRTLCLLGCVQILLLT